MNQVPRMNDEHITNNLPCSKQGFGRIGIVTNGFESAYFMQIVQTVSKYLATRGLQTVVQSKVPLVANELATLNSLSENDCDGLIIHADTLTNEQLEDFMYKHPKSALLSRRVSCCPERCVHIDNVLGGKLAARHLISQGHTRIAMVRGPDTYCEANDRAKGFVEELENNDLTLSAELYADFIQSGGANAMQQIHEKHPEITAVFFHNDEMAFGALDTCRTLKIKVPEELSIIGFDGIATSDYVSPRLTSIRQPLHQLAEHAAKVVCDLVFEEEKSKRTIGISLSPKLHERESVTAPAKHCENKASLTQREVECLTWTANGKTSWEISVILGVSESTATFHLRNAGVKLKASNRAHAVAKALHLGLITLS